MNTDSQEHHDNIRVLQYELYHMSISALASEVAGGGSSQHSPILLNPLQASHGDEPPPLCSCGLDVCACHTLSEAGHMTTRTLRPRSPLPVCSCHNQEVAVTCPKWLPMAQLILRQIRNEVRFTTTLSVIMLVIQQLQSSTPYGAIPSEVQVRVRQMIDLSEAEYRLGVCWLLEESHVMSPLDDGRLMLVMQRDVSNIYTGGKVYGRVTSVEGPLPHANQAQAAR
ncbi:uncharacterized protein F5147DRAFT_652909 [Suillus discolor]|uniref:Uncharacterized protein n=1 Tax=Suillus discolor TaxID=1912936 RepID=A0A9P7JTY4_9AGAM|nr:uncharacterized protein F5147DRAFT_652909 [Suillus discolor]KAG2108186.1 hypothetical protein F5147DRAFT_652909 [Suillus discolor]